MTYTYFAATLPALQFDAEPAMTEEDFLGRCREYLRKSDFKTLCALLNDSETKNSYVANWRNKTTQLRNAVAQHRATRLGDASAAKQWQRPHSGLDVSIANAVSLAFQEPDPMRRDFAIERIRWNIASDLAGFDPFSAEVFFTYAIHLSILNRRKAADPEKGIARLHEMRKLQAAAEE